jgi:hypothetical protein
MLRAVVHRLQSSRGPEDPLTRRAKSAMDAIAGDR